MSVVFKQKTKAFTLILLLQKTLRTSFLYNVLQGHNSMTHACMACSALLDSLILKMFLGESRRSCERNLRCSKELSNFSNFWKQNMFVSPTVSPQSEPTNTRKPSETGSSGALLIPNLQGRVQTPRHGPGGHPSSGFGLGKGMCTNKLYIIMI